MAFTPITGAWSQLSSAVNNLALDHYIKFYDAGTTTPFSMATTSTGGTLLAKAKINSKGFPISNPLDEKTTFTAHIDRDYRLIIYTNETDADANTVANALVDLDNNIQQIAPVSDADFIDIGGLTLTQQDDFWKSPLYTDGNGFVAGTGPHTIIIKTSNVDDAVWDPTDSNFRSYRINSSGLLTDLTPTATTSTSFTIPDTLSSTDTVFHGDDLVRYVRRSDSLVKSESDTLATSKAVFDAVGMDKLNFSGDAESILDFSDAAQGFTFFNGDLIRITGTGGTITVHDGVSDTVLFSFAAPSANTQDITIANGDLISTDGTNNEINIHTGISSSITTTFSSPDTGPTGIAFDGTNIISSDGVTDLIYIHVGLTAATSSSFATPAAESQALEVHDGNLISTDVATNRVYHHDAITGTIAYNHLGGGASGQQGVAVLNNVLYTNNSTDDDIYRHGRQIQLSDSINLDSSKIGASAKAVFDLDADIRGDLSDSITSTSSTDFASSKAVSDLNNSFEDRYTEIFSSMFFLGSSIGGITIVDSEDLMRINTTLSDLDRYSGVTNNVVSTQNDASGIRHLAYDGTNLLSIDQTNDEIRIHTGETATISSTFATPSTTPTGLVYDGTNLISCDSGTNLIYIHSGITSTISSSFASPASNINGLAFDGTDLISQDAGTNLIYVHSGITSTIRYTFTNTREFGESDLATFGEVLLIGFTNSNVVVVHPKRLTRV